MGLLVNEWCKQKDYTLQQLARQVGVAAAYISQVENGKVSPPITVLRSLAKVLDRRTVDFFVDELIDDPAVCPPSY